MSYWSFWGVNLKLFIFKQYNNAATWNSGTAQSNCGGNYVVGGYALLDGNSRAQITFYNIPNHYYLQITYGTMQID
jgi:hypothetical protein